MPNTKNTNRPTHAVAPFNVTADETGNNHQHQPQTLSDKLIFLHYGKPINVHGLRNYVHLMEMYYKPKPQRVVLNNLHVNLLAANKNAAGYHLNNVEIFWLIEILKSLPKID